VLTRPRIAYGLLITALAASAAAAQTPDPPRFNTDVVVTPERSETPRALVPAATVVIDRETVATLPAVVPAEAMSFLPGFNVMRPELYANRPIISSRGFFGGGEAEYVTLLVDGVRVADAESGLIDWSAIPSTSIRRVEAYRGPAASLYGDAAVGGVIQILTDRSSSGGEATVSGGSYDSFTVDGTYGHRGSRVGFALSGALRRTDGGFDHSAAHQAVGAGSLDGSARGYMWRWSVSGGSRDRDDPGSLGLDVIHASPYSSDPMFQFDTLDRQDFSTAFSLRNGSSAWHPQARAYVTTRSEDLIRTIPLAPGVADRRARALSSDALGGSIEAEHAVGKTTLHVGVDLTREHLDTSYRSVSDAGAIGAFNTEADGHRVRAGLFALGSWQAAPRVRLSAGVRRDLVDDEGFGGSADAQQAWSPKGGVSILLTESGSVSLFAQMSRAFKAPTLDQRFDPRPFPNFRGGTFTISNRNLVPQRADGVEAGVAGGGVVRWSALAYRMGVDEEIDFDLRTFSYANIGRSRHVGAELEAEGRWWKRVRPSATYALTKVVDVDAADDVQLKNIPRHRATAGIAIDLPYALGITARYDRTWGAFLDDASLFALDGRSTLDVRLRRPIGRHALFVDVLNATNHLSEEFGFTLTDFRGRPVPYAYPGAPRAIRGGLTVAF
jgi:iron complex outermembrane recepter protein